MNALANKQENQIATYVEEPVKLLDPRAEGGVISYESGQSMKMWAATISAGYKDGDTPRVVRDGKIRLHEDMGEAPGIKAALAATEHKSITITMLSDNIGDCLKQLFCAYGTVKIFGDQNSLTTMKLENGKQVRETIPSSDPRFQSMLSLCKPCTFVPFALAEWDEQNNPSITFPDGLVPYRLRFGSINSAKAFVDSLQAIKRLTGGHLVGVPLVLSIAYKTVMTPDLKRQSVPVWNPVLKHPKGIQFGARDIQRVLTAGIRDAQQMALPASIALDEQVMEAVVVSEERIADEETGEVIMQGSHQDLRTITTAEVPARRQEDYFKAMQGTPYVTDAHRPRLIQRMADAAGVVISNPSLRELAEVATASEWEICAEVMCKAAAAYHGTEETKPPKAVVSDDPYAQLNEAANTQQVVVTEPVQEAVITEPVRKQKPPEAEPEKQAQEEAKAELPKVNNYLALDRQPTAEESKAASAYTKKHFNADQFMQIGKAAGGIDVRFVILEARRQGITDFTQTMRLLDENFGKEEQAGLEL